MRRSFTYSRPHWHFMPRWLAMLVMAAVALTPVPFSSAHALLMDISSIHHGMPPGASASMSDAARAAPAVGGMMDCKHDGKMEKGEPCDCCPSDAQKENCVGGCLAQGLQLAAYLPEAEFVFPFSPKNFTDSAAVKALVPRITEPPKRPPISV